jgi:hypothetical protein
MQNRRIVNVAAALATAASWVALYLILRPHPPAIDARPHEVAGEILAAETLRVLPAGGRIIVLARDTKAFDVPASAAQLRGFEKALKKAGGKIGVARSFRMEPLRPMKVSPDDFFELLRQSKEQDVFVSFLGPPMLSNQQLTKLGSKRPVVLAVCTGQIVSNGNVRRLFDQKLLTAAVISRDDAPARATGENRQGAFEQMFRLITPANLSELPGATVARN